MTCNERLFRLLTDLNASQNAEILSDDEYESKELIAQSSTRFALGAHRRVIDPRFLCTIQEPAQTWTP